MKKHPALSLVEHFKDLPDPRVDRTKDHALVDVLIIAVCRVVKDPHDRGLKAVLDVFDHFAKIEKATLGLLGLPQIGGVNEHEDRILRQF